jgi:hypothetical protein
MFLIHELSFDEYPELATFLHAETADAARETLSELKETYPFSHHGHTKHVSPYVFCAALGKLIQLECLLGLPGPKNIMTIQKAYLYAIAYDQLTAFYYLQRSEVPLARHITYFKMAVNTGRPALIDTVLESMDLTDITDLETIIVLHTACLHKNLSLVQKLIHHEVLSKTLLSCKERDMECTALFKLALHNELFDAARILLNFAPIRHALVKVLSPKELAEVLHFLPCNHHLAARFQVENTITEERNYRKEHYASLADAHAHRRVTIAAAALLSNVLSSDLGTFFRNSKNSSHKELGLDCIEIFRNMVGAQGNLAKIWPLLQRLIIHEQKMEKIVVLEKTENWPLFKTLVHDFLSKFSKEIDELIDVEQCKYKYRFQILPSGELIGCVKNKTPATAKEQLRLRFFCRILNKIEYNEEEAEEERKFSEKKLGIGMDS